MTQTAKGPDGWPLIGSAWALYKTPLSTLTASAQEYGDVVRFRFGPDAMNLTGYLVVRPEGIKRVLVENHRNYVKSPSYDALRPLLGDGLLTSKGELWKRHRRLANPSFRRKRVHAIAQTMVDSTVEHIDRWTLDQPLDVALEMRKLTLTILTRAMFGANIDEHAEAIDEALTVLLRIAAWRMTFPFDLPEAVPTPNHIRTRRALKVLDAIVEDIISTRRSAGGQHNDLLSMLMEAQDDETGQGLTDRELRDEVMTFLVAGHETTAGALTFTLKLLAESDDASAKLRHELDAHLDGRLPDVSDHKALSYTLKTVQEGMRLYPPAWIVERYAVEDDVVGDILIPAKSFVMVSPWVTHRQPDLWPDPERFDPDRFDDALSKARPRHAYLPFGAGQRMCIGEHFAVLEAQLALATIMQRVDLVLAEPDKELELEALITLRPKDGLMMTPRRR